MGLSSLQLRNNVRVLVNNYELIWKADKQMAG